MGRGMVRSGENFHVGDEGSMPYLARCLQFRMSNFVS